MATIVDSGERRQFETGAVRDIQEGKGRCDLLPLDIIPSLMDTPQQASVLYHVGEYVKTGHTEELYVAIRSFNDLVGWTTTESLMEVSKQYEDGAAKYGERNWEKGIHVHSFIDSGVRHFLKHIGGHIDERHDRAFVWNMLGAIWTHKHHPELIDIPFSLLSDNFEGSKEPVPEVIDDVEVVDSNDSSNSFPPEIMANLLASAGTTPPAQVPGAADLMSNLFAAASAPSGEVEQVPESEPEDVDMVSIPREFLSAMMAKMPQEEVK